MQILLDFTVISNSCCYNYSRKGFRIYICDYKTNNTVNICNRELDT